MGWATRARDALTRGEAVQLRPRGHSMTGRINDGDLVTVAPCDASGVQVGDAVFVRIHGNYVLHLVKAIQGIASSSAIIAARSVGGSTRAPSWGKSFGSSRDKQRRGIDSAQPLACRHITGHSLPLPQRCLGSRNAAICVAGAPAVSRAAS